MAQLSQQRDWSCMLQVFWFKVTAHGMRVTWLLCYFVNTLTCMVKISNTSGSYNGCFKVN